MTDYSMEGRTYRYFKGEAYYPFGFGLSYTTFEYTGMLVPLFVEAGQDITGSIVVQNTGIYTADEVTIIHLLIVWRNNNKEPRGSGIDFRSEEVNREKITL